jgi:hypothetical protein
MLDYVTALPRLSNLDANQTRLVATMRLWAICQKHGRCPMVPLAERLGSLRTAAHFHLLLEEMGAAWPDPFCVSPPCCPMLSHDEATFARMLGAAGRDDRRAFDEELKDLIPADARERLFLSTSMVVRREA